MADISSTERSAMSDLQSLFNHMFSKDVIENDSFLQSCISPAMTIPLSVILESPRVLSVTTDQNLIRRALTSSNCVSVLGDQVRPNFKLAQNTVILRDLGSEATEEALRRFFTEHNCPTVESCKSEMNSTWFVSFASEDDARTSLLQVRGAKFNGVPVRARLKTESIAAKSHVMINTGPSSAPPPSARIAQQQVHRGSPRHFVPQYPHQQQFPHKQQQQFQQHQQYQQYQQSGMGMGYYAVGPDGRVWPMMPQGAYAGQGQGHEQSHGRQGHGQHLMGQNHSSAHMSTSSSVDGRSVLNQQVKKGKGPAGGSKANPIQSNQEGQSAAPPRKTVDSVHAEVLQEDSTEDSTKDTGKQSEGTEPQSVQKKKKSVKKAKRKDHDSLSQSESHSERRGPSEGTAAKHLSTTSPPSSGVARRSNDGQGKGAKSKGNSSLPSQEFNFEVDFPSLALKTSSDVKDHSSSSSSSVADAGAPQVSWAEALSKDKVTKSNESATGESSVMESNKGLSPQQPLVLQLASSGDCIPEAVDPPSPLDLEPLTHHEAPQVAANDEGNSAGGDIIDSSFKEDIIDCNIGAGIRSSELRPLEADKFHDPFSRVDVVNHAGNGSLEAGDNSKQENGPAGKPSFLDVLRRSGEKEPFRP